MSDKSLENKYVIRVYDVGTNEPPCVPYGKDTMTPLARQFADNKKELIEKWRVLYRLFQGFGYTLFKGDVCIISGALDSSDEYILEDLEEDKLL